MRKDFLDIVEHAHALGYTTQEVVTNGTMITDAHLERLQGTPSVQLHISIDGPRAIQDELRGEGVYDKSVDTARRALARGIKVGLSGVIMRETMATLTHLLDLAVELGVGEVSYQPFQTEISGPDKDIPRFSPHAAAAQGAPAPPRRGVRLRQGAGRPHLHRGALPAIPGYLLEGKRPIPAGGLLPSPPSSSWSTGAATSSPASSCARTRWATSTPTASPPSGTRPSRSSSTSWPSSERCPGCLAACSDVETANQSVGAATPFVTAGESTVSA